MALAEMAALGTLTGFLMMVATVATPEPQLPEFPLACRINAYVAEPNPKGLTVRGGPGEQYGVFKQIPPDAEGPAMLMIRAGQGNWMKVTDVQSPKGQLLYAGPGWVYGPLLELSVRLSVLDSETANLYAQPDTRTAVKATLPVSTTVKILNCQGSWAKVRAATGEGWLQFDNQCGKPTGCL